nr:uncharacterized protein LOC122172762 [Chrysemys picta bellii]
MDMIFAAQEIQEKAREQSKDQCMVFVDLTKVFDTVNCKDLWKLLHKVGCLEKMIAIICSFRTGMMTMIMECGDSSEAFPVTNSTKQGLDGEEEEGDEEDEAVDSAYNADFPDSQDFFITLTEIPYQLSPAINPDPDSGEGSAAVAVSRPTLSSDSQRLSQIRHRRKRTRDDMFSELMSCSRAESTLQSQWRENLSQMHRSHMEREERWWQEDQQATQTLLGLMREQTDTLQISDEELTAATQCILVKAGT